MEWNSENHQKVKVKSMMMTSQVPQLPWIPAASGYLYNTKKVKLKEVLLGGMESWKGPESEEYNDDLKVARSKKQVGWGTWLDDDVPAPLES